MQVSILIGLETGTSLPKKIRKAGRPRAIPPEMESTVMEIYRQGYGYRAIARILNCEYHISTSFSSVKRVLKRSGSVRKNVSPLPLNQ